jgi:hypothetical protein
MLSNGISSYFTLVDKRIRINTLLTPLVMNNSSVSHVYYQTPSPESYAGDSVATGRASHAGQVKGDDPDEKGYPSPPGCGLGHGADNPIPIK